MGVENANTQLYRSF